jgi:hypothetical protein
MVSTGRINFELKIEIIAPGELLMGSLNGFACSWKPAGPEQCRNM